MDNKSKLVVIGLAGILLISLFLNFQLSSNKSSAMREMEDLRRENGVLMQKIEASLDDSQRLQSRIGSLNAELEKATQEKDDLERKFDLVSRERQQLIDKMKEQKRPSVEAPRPGSLSDDAYWAGILKAKTALEMQLDGLREELGTTKIANEELQRQKSGLLLEVSNLTRQAQDLTRQLDYNQKLMDSLAQELVREKNDKMQIEDTLKSLKNENTVLMRNLKNLEAGKANLEKQFADMKEENSSLDSRLKEMEELLKSRSMQIDSLQRQLQDGKLVSPQAEEKIGESVELPAIVVRPGPPAPQGPKSQEAPVAAPAAVAEEGNILAVNKENNFVIIDRGEDSGVKMGDNFKAMRNGKQIAELEVIQTRNGISACDIKNETTALKVGDTFR